MKRTVLRRVSLANSQKTHGSNFTAERNVPDEVARVLKDEEHEVEKVRYYVRRILLRALTCVLQSSIAKKTEIWAGLTPNRAPPECRAT